MPTFFRRSIRRTALSASVLAAALGAAQGCTDLTETPRDALTPENAFKTEAEILAGSASVYAQLRSAMWEYYNLSEITTDEQVVPTRGNDWFDNGRWLEIYRHRWTPNSGSALEDMNGLWNNMFSGVAKANLMIDVVQKGNSPTAAANLAELRTLRAWYYYVLMDTFGGLPLVTTTQVEARPRESRDSVFKFIEAELKASRTALPVKPAQYGRVSRGMADAMLANMYINAPVFQGTVTPAGLQRAPARHREAAAFADSVINSGQYSMAADYHANFSTTNESSPELIFSIVHTATPGLGMSLPMRVLHYNQLDPSPWNGFATIAETYRTFEAADRRRNVFLIGQQRNFNSGAAVRDRAGAPLVYTDTIGDLTKANENEGARLLKFPPLPGAAAGDAHPNDYPLFRLAEMYMIKAEALNELGQTADAIALINTQLRARAFSPPRPLSTGLSQAQARAAILNERLFEFVGEGKRRQDLIRLGGLPGLETRGFTAARFGKPADEPFRVLLPIPATQIQNNPRLVQNPGYQ